MITLFFKDIYTKIFHGRVHYTKLAAVAGFMLPKTIMYCLIFVSIVQSKNLLSDIDQSPLMTPVSNTSKTEDAGTAPAVAVHVGQFTLHVPRPYIDAGDGFQGPFGYLKIKALLPCLTPNTLPMETTYPTSGWAGKLVAKVSIRDEHRLSADEYLKIRIKNNKQYMEYISHPEALDDNGVKIENTNFSLYKDNLNKSDLFYIKNSKPFFMLDCKVKDQYVLSPECSSSFNLISTMIVDYSFDRSFIDRDIQQATNLERGVKALFEKFLVSDNEAEASIKGVCQ